MMSLALAHDKMGWPPPDEVHNPSGAGARIFAQLAHDKIETTLASRADAVPVKVGVLARNSNASETESPLAVVAEFRGKASEQILRELHRLAWNFSHAPTVVTIEPELMRVWTCCEPPEVGRFLNEYVIHQVSASGLGKTRPSEETARAAQVLHWANLVSGQFFRDQPLRFPREKRADQMLLGNLRHLRGVLRKAGLTNDDICHDLLARVIFVQFLFDRKDSSGNSALNANKLADLHESSVLKEEHHDFASILDNYDDTYRLFDWLNDRFNGDLFPGRGSAKQERERAWLMEKSHVKPRHLQKLRDFVKGDLDMPKGQLCLWPAYSFDAIPLEFISSIYEAFVTERARSEGIYYTPPHLVDFMLDRVLPWGGDQWDLKVLDPACGSGIFLVKAFQRLIHRWKNSHPNENIRAETLRGLLEQNVFGVDKDPHAVRVASFSLYLAMCDEIDPKHYWTQVHFPLMRQRRLIHADFFEENHPGFRTKEDAASYDLVVGNAPWGETLLTKAAKEWANEETRRWPLPNKGIGTLFLPKAAALTKATGRVSMVQSASSLLFNRSGPACGFRKKLFTTLRVEQVVNLSALRFKVFNQRTRTTQKSVAPSCIVTLLPGEGSREHFPYISPKLAEDFAEEFDILVEPQDVKHVNPSDAAEMPELWTALLWGNRRDQVLIHRLLNQPNIERQIGPNGTRRGVEFGNRKKYRKELEHRQILLEGDFPSNGLFSLSALTLP
ncbi:MAG: N-6 DNA methylase, partial [Verrucomicrobiota bacterium]